MVQMHRRWRGWGRSGRRGKWAGRSRRDEGGRGVAGAARGVATIRVEGWAGRTPRGASGTERGVRIKGGAERALGDAEGAGMTGRARTGGRHEGARQVWNGGRQARLTWRERAA